MVMVTRILSLGSKYYYRARVWLHNARAPRHAKPDLASARPLTSLTYTHAHICNKGSINVSELITAVEYSVEYLNLYSNYQIERSKAITAV